MTDIRPLLKQCVECGLAPTDSSELRLKKVALTLVTLIIGPLAVVWGSIYVALGHWLSGAIPLTYAVVSLIGLVHVSRTKDVRFIQASQLVLVLLLPFLLMWSLGGFAAGSMVMIWAIFAPTAGVMFLERQRALGWFLAFLFLTVVSVVIDPTAAAAVPHLPDWAQRGFLLLNIGGGSAGLYLLMSYSLNEEKRGLAASMRIAATAFESIEGMIVTDAKQVILRVNQAFTTITGHTADDAVGQTPAMLAPGRYDEDFQRTMRAHIQAHGSWQGELWCRRRNGEVFPAWHMVTAVKDEAGVTTHHVHTFTDMTSRKQAEQAIESLAFYDPLTGLPNRRLLLDRLKQAVAASARSGRHGALLFLDLDNFKTLNDTLGHDVGDQLLQQVGKLLADRVRSSDTVARLGGDEFVVVLEDLGQAADEALAHTSNVGRELLATLNRAYQLGPYTHHSTGSIGATLFVGDQGPLDDLLKRADLAMYQAKAAGRNTLRFFDPEMETTVQARMSLEADLRQAIQDEQFQLHYQVQVDAEGRVLGVEALLRWPHPQRGMVPPLEFIPLAEDTGLILPIGQWVLEAACRQLAQWSRQPPTSDLTLAVNLSARQLRHPDFVASVAMALEQSGARPGQLKLELTESLLVEDVEQAIEKMAQLRAMGVRFSLDDFGMGYSSLSYLKRLPLDELKIDRSFVRDILTDANDAAIARMVVVLAESLGLRVVAEGVEDQAQVAVLATIGCRVYQGYLFGRPMPQEAVAAFMQRAPAAVEHPRQVPAQIERSGQSSAAGA